MECPKIGSENKDKRSAYWEICHINVKQSLDMKASYVDRTLCPVHIGQFTTFAT